MCRRLLIVVSFFIFAGFCFGDKAVLVKNSLKDIGKVDGKIELKPVHVFGSDESEYEEDYFKNPADVAIDNNGNIYIADNQLSCIKVYDSEGKFLRKIGKAGQGPGDLIAPVKLGVFNKELFVKELGNQRIQKLDFNGKSIFSHKTDYWLGGGFELLKADTYLHAHTMMTKKKISRLAEVINNKDVKAVIGEGMKLPVVRKEKDFPADEVIHCVYSRINKRYYLAYNSSQMVQIFSEKGKLVRTICYDTELNSFDMIWDAQLKNYRPDKLSKRLTVCTGLAVDNNNLIYVVVSKRDKNKYEGEMVSISPNGLECYPSSKEYPDNTDLYWLLVFNNEGKVVAKKQLDRYCAGIKLHEDKLFIIDTVFNKRVYQYKIKLI